MASKKKESEGIALLSMYGDEDDDDMEHDASDNETVPVENKEQSEVGGSEAADMEEDGIADADKSLGYGNSIDANDSRTPVTIDRLTSPPAQQVIGTEPSRGRKETLTIVDYGHDEAALSPEPEEGEIAATGRVMFGAELQTVNGTPPGTVQLLTPNTQSTPQSSEHVDQSQSDAMNYKGNESESAAPEEAVNIAEDGEKEMDPLDRFLPPPPMTKCTDELQEKIIKFLMLKKKTGRSFNSEVRNRKEYRNPDFLLHAVTYQDIDQIGSCFSKDVFDPHGYDKSDYYDEIAAVDTGTSTREGRPNKKSKWDKVDGDRRPPLTTSSQDSVSSAGSHAALLTAANAGSGYTAFAQQRRREADERRSSDRKLDRRS